VVPPRVKPALSHSQPGSRVPFWEGDGENTLLPWPERRAQPGRDKLLHAFLTLRISHHERRHNKSVQKKGERLGEWEVELLLSLLI